MQSEEFQQVQHCKSTFSEKFVQQIWPILEQDKSVREKINGFKWIFTLNKQWISVLSELQLTQCQKIVIENYDQSLQFNLPPVIQLISKCIFSNLKNLSIIGNQISSIEGLTFIDMENLSELDIANNPITYLKTLDKATWKNLNFISFYDTPVIHVRLNRLKIKKQCNMILTTYLDEIRKIQDNSYVFKLQMNTRNILLITELNSIQQLKLRKMMRERFPKK